MRITATFAILVLLASCASTRGPAPRSQTPFDPAEERLARELGIVSLTSTASVLIRRGDTEAALTLLEHELDRSVGEAELYVKSGTRLPPDTPHLVEATRRAADYARDNRLPELSKRLQALHHQLR